MKSKFRLPRLLPALLMVASLALPGSISGLAAPALDPTLAQTEAAPALAPSVAPSQTALQSPDAFLGFEVGADRQLADWNQMLDYFEMLGRDSDRVHLQTIGETTLGRPMIMAIISSPANLARLDRYREIQKKLSNPQGLSDAELAALMAEAKPVVAISASIHSTEIAATQMSLKLAYELASSDVAKVGEVLDRVILLLVPSLNPDGHQMTVDWYRKYLGTPYEGTGTPWLYHYYAGHDDNRDWFSFNLKETRAYGRQLYQLWFPEIAWDVHQMGNGGARLFVPPFMDPSNPVIDPVILRSLYLLGGHITTDLAAAGMKGVSTNAQYDSWYHGANRTAPAFHNMVGILTEAASVDIASPITQRLEDLDIPTRGLPDAQHPLSDFPDVWPGGEWHLKDIVDYEETAAWSILTVAARYGDSFVRNFVDMNRRSVLKGLTESPSAYVIPAEQRDPVTTVRMINTLIFQGIQVYRADAPFQADGRSYSAGAYVVLASQPTRPNVLALLGKQSYPDRRNPDGSPEMPYDIVGWTLPMQMGVAYDEIQSLFDARLSEVKEAVPPAGVVLSGPASYGYAFGPEQNDVATARIRLLKEGYQLAWATEPLTVGDKSFAPGATIVKARDGLVVELASLARELSLSFYPVDSAPAVEIRQLSLPRVGVYESWAGNMDSGWPRFLFDRFEIPFAELHDADVRAGGLGDRFDAIVIADQGTATIVNGRRPGSYPEEYTGGIGEQGVESLDAFVRGGGTLVTLGNAGDFAIEKLGVPVKNLLRGVETSRFYAPGSILAGKVDSSQPLGFGMGERADFYFTNSSAYEAAEGVTVATYGDGALLRSGWLLGERYLQNRGAAVDVALGNGKVEMIGFRSQHRAQSDGTFKLLFNALFYATVR